MSEKVYDNYQRWRNRQVGFRASEEEAKRIDELVALSGMTKRAYIMDRLENKEIRVYPNPRVYKALRESMTEIYNILVEINKRNEKPDSELLELIRIISIMLFDIKGG